jgi:ElaB/YqjD/DUF883 family membrane-anchored ribosome-binding protein
MILRRNRQVPDRSEIAQTIEETVDKVKHSAEDLYDRSSANVRDAYGRCIDYCRTNPGKAVWLVFGAGVGLGILLSGFRSNHRRR